MSTGEPDATESVRRLTRRWIAPSGGRGSGGGDLGAARLTWTRKREGPQHGGEARNAAKTPKVLPCKARVIWRSPNWLKPSLQRCKRSHLPTRRLMSGPPASGDSDFRHLNPPGRWATGSEPVQGDGRDTYVTLDTSSARGIRDGLRGASPTVTECP